MTLLRQERDIDRKLELYVPLARRIYGGDGMPLSMAPYVSAVTRGRSDTSAIAHMFGGRAAKPKRPILMYGPDSRVTHVIWADGQTEAAELEEVACETLEKAEQRMRETGRALNIDERRARAGLPPREKVDELIRDALRRRAQEHQRNPIADPARMPQRVEEGW